MRIYPQHGRIRLSVERVPTAFFDLAREHASLTLPNSLADAHQFVDSIAFAYDRGGADEQCTDQCGRVGLSGENDERQFGISPSQLPQRLERIRLERTFAHG
ncbi:hypothetical protein A9R05_22915 [Burkholderia sp. KK1]|nr:hypothetical protein A9R05_22915 [Burkholderia sp. KK1]